jgi:hypothetical protein
MLSSGRTPSTWPGIAGIVVPSRKDTLLNEREMLPTSVWAEEANGLSAANTEINLATASFLEVEWTDGTIGCT